MATKNEIMAEVLTRVNNIINSSEHSPAKGFWRPVVRRDDQGQHYTSLTGFRVSLILQKLNFTISPAIYQLLDIPPIALRVMVDLSAVEMKRRAPYTNLPNIHSDSGLISIGFGRVKGSRASYYRDQLQDKYPNLTLDAIRQNCYLMNALSRAAFALKWHLRPNSAPKVEDKTRYRRVI